MNTALLEVLKKEFGITNEKEFEDVVAATRGINIGLFVSDIEKGSNEERISA